MMKKSALAGGGGRCTPTPCQPITITYKVEVYAPAERADTLPSISSLSYMYSLVKTSASDSTTGRSITFHIEIRRMRENKGN